MVGKHGKSSKRDWEKYVAVKRLCGSQETALLQCKLSPASFTPIVRPCLAPPPQPQKKFNFWGRPVCSGIFRLTQGQDFQTEAASLAPTPPAGGCEARMMDLSQCVEQSGPSPGPPLPGTVLAGFKIIGIFLEPNISIFFGIPC